MNGLFNVLPRLFCLALYHYSVFFRKFRSYPPLVLWGITLYLAYEPAPINIVQGYLSTSIFLFFAMVWFSYSFLSDFDAVTEHLLILQINSRLLYAASKILFLLTVLGAVSVIGSAYPAILELALRIRGLTHITYGIHLTDLLGGILLHFIVGSLGIAIAFLFQPNPSKRDNSNTILMLILFAFSALLKHQIFGFQGALQYTLLVFSPLYEILSLFSDSRTFAAGDLALSAIYSGIYFSLAIVIGYWLYNKRVYGPLIAKHK